LANLKVWRISSIRQTFVVYGTFSMGVLEDGLATSKLKIPTYSSFGDLMAEND